MMRVLIADRFSERRLQKMSERGYEVRYEPELHAGSLAESVHDAEVLVVRSTPVTADTIEAGQGIGLIIRAGAGTDTIDVEAASSNGIYVCRVPGKNAVAVAELTMGLLLALDRRIPDNVASMRDGEWKKSEFAKARGLKGRRIGIIGMGAIGMEVAKRARAFGMKVSALAQADRSEDRSSEISNLRVDLHTSIETLLPECDVVSLHVPAAEGTIGLVDSHFLGHMQDGAWLINTSRGEVVNAKDLIEALDEKGMWAALDVFPDEPKVGATSWISELAQHPRVYGTHHIGGSTEQAQEAIAKQVARIIDSYADGGVVGAVNLAQPMPSTTVISVRHIDQVGVLSSVFAVLRRANLNVEHMENHIFAGARAANAVIHVHGDFTDAVRRELSQLDAVLHVGILRETPGDPA